MRAYLEKLALYLPSGATDMPTSDGASPTPQDPGVQQAFGRIQRRIRSRQPNLPFKAAPMQVSSQDVNPSGPEVGSEGRY